MPVITLSNQKTFISEPGITLLDSARSQGIALEYSCRTGRCGVCKAKVLGDTEVNHEEHALAQSEKNDGFILTCCRSALTDIALDIEDLGLLGAIQSKTLPCRIDFVQRLSKDVVQIFLRVPPGNQLEFLAGQYIDVIGQGGVRRSYSIANAPRPDGKLELQIRHVEQGIMSQYWFGEAKQNDLLRLEGPLGTFSLRESKAHSLVFLATGTGIAPVKAMLEQLASNPYQAANKTIYVYWGGRTPDDIYWKPSFDTLDLKFIPVLSRAEENWIGRKGYIQQALLDDGIQLIDSVVYACGSDAMIHSARELLLAAGLSKKNFHSDAFVSSN